MNTLIPTFLFAYANDEARSLRLSEEERLLREVLAPAHDQRRIETLQLGHATLEGVYKAFNRFHNRIAIFHYGGHSDHEFLNLEDKMARSSALSTLIGQQKNLQLVFLNGCANRKQVQHLFDNKVKAVIATYAPVNDERATQFAHQFYHALANGKNIKNAFDTAKGFVLNDDNQFVIHYTRDASFVGIDDDALFPWGLYVQDESVLEWTLPPVPNKKKVQDFLQEVTLNLADVNEELVLNTVSGMAEHQPNFKVLFDMYQQQPSSTMFNTLQNMLLDSLPSMMSVQIRDLFTPEGKSQGRVRLRELSEAYSTLARLLCSIAMANLWDVAAAVGGQNKPLVIRPSYLEDIKKYIRWSPISGTPVDYLWLVRTISCIFKENSITPYVKELVTLDEKFQDATPVYDAYRFLEQQLRQRLIAGNIARPEVEALCKASEHHLSVLLRAASFLCNYQVVTVKTISVDFPRRDPKPAFIHQKAILKGRDYATIDMAPMRSENVNSNNSVFITRDLESEGLSLNLSPFVIDQNAFKQKQQCLPKIYFFNGLQEETLHFLHADTKDLDFVISEAADDPLYKNLDRLFVGVELFRKDLGI